MPIVMEIRNWIDGFAPYDTAEEWDNSGLLFGKSQQAVHHVCVALDVTEGVLEECVAMGADLLLTHHPFLFSPLRRMTDETYQGKLLWNAADHGISLLCAHTNLDQSKDGINAYLCDLLGIRNEEATVPFRTGVLQQPMPLHSFLQRAQECLGCMGLKFSGDPERLIRQVSVCSGSGSEFMSEAALKGSDLLLTSDTKYHDHQAATELGICLADAGHFETEQIICPILAERLKQEFPDVAVSLAQSHRGFYRYL